MELFYSTSQTGNISLHAKWFKYDKAYIYIHIDSAWFNGILMIKLLKFDAKKECMIQKLFDE